MTEKQYSPEERRKIVAAFRSAKKNLWNGHGDEKLHESEFICHAMDGFLPGQAMAREVIMGRIGKAYDLETWLKQQGLKDLSMAVEDWRIAVQAHRLAWLNLLIKEFSK